MTDLDVEREAAPEKPHEFDPAKVSPSRVNSYDECGIAFRLKYIDGIPEKVMGTWALFGNVCHTALEKWTPNRDQDLLTLMRQAWISETQEKGKVVTDFLQEYQTINVSVLKAEQKAREAFENRPDNKKAGKKSKAPRMTKVFKDSKAAKDLNKLLARWIPKLDAESPWKFTEFDPLPQLYDDSLVIAKRYQKQWGHLPPGLHTEFSFAEEWEGFTLNGYIDGIEMLMNPETGEAQGIGVIDYKTYKAQPAPMKDWRQLVMYDIALRSLVDRGAIQLPFSLDDYPLYVGIDYVRFAHVGADWLPQKPEGNSRQFWQITDEDREALLKDLQMYRAGVEAELFRPAPKTAKADFCDYGDLCCLNNPATRGGCSPTVEVSL